VLDLDVALPSVTKPDSEIQFNLGAGSGQFLDLLITIAKQTTKEDGNGLLSYAGPRISSSAGCSTAGGTVTIFGRNFGPLGSANINSVTIRGVPCTNAQVVSSPSKFPERKK
jgi:hypothetical protein